MDEYISKESAISVFEAKAEMAGCTPAQPYFHKAAKMIELLPAADVTPVRHGRWCWDGRFRACSICGSYVEFTETLGASHWKYCPYCGAKMDLED